MHFRLLIISCLIGTACFAQKPIPDSVVSALTNAFDNEFPGAKAKGWTLSGENYVTEARIEGQNATVSFSRELAWIETNYKYSREELPGKILNYLSSSYKDYDPFLTNYVESKNNGAYYYIQIRKKGNTDPAAEFFFDSSGNLMKKNEFFPITEALSTSVSQEAERKQKEETERKAREEARAKLLAMDRNVAESELPKKVRDNFYKKFPKTEGVRWDSIDATFTAYFTVDEMEWKSDFLMNGDWSSTTERLDPAGLFAPVQKYLDENHPGLKVKIAEKVTRRDKNNLYYVELIPRKKTASPPVTRIWFDKNGNHTRTEEPPRPVVAEEIQNDEPVAEEVKDKLADKIDESEINLDADNTVVPPGELPSPVITYVQENYPGYKIKEGHFGNYEEGENVYKVGIRKEGLAQQMYFLFFTDKGGLISTGLEPVKKDKSTPAPRPAAKPGQKEKPARVKPQKPKDEPLYVEAEVKEKVELTGKGEPDRAKTVKNAEENRQKPEIKAEEPEKEAEPEAIEEAEPKLFTSRAPDRSKLRSKKGDESWDTGDEADVPENVKKSFSRKFPKAFRPTWTVDEKLFTVDFFQNEMKNTVSFSPDAVAQITRVELDPGLLMNPIRKYIDENFKYHKMKYAERVTRKDRKNYFYVEIFTKRKNISPAEAVLFFDPTGRLMKTSPE